MGSRKKVLFFAEAVTLAHVARPVTLAESLNSTRFDVTLAWHPRYQSLFKDFTFAQREIRSIEIADFLATLSSGRPSYDLETLREYVAEDLHVLDDIAPDLVVGDFRLSLSVSARLRDIPYLNVTNAYWSPFADVRIPAPDVPPFRWLPKFAAQPLFDLIKPFAFARNAKPMVDLHREFGIPPPPQDVRAAYTFADYVAYVDIPELVPMREMPGKHRFIGPVLWSPACDLPDWWGALEAETLPIIYVTLGSSGADSILPRVIAALEQLPVIGIVASAGNPWDGKLPPNIHLVKFIPGEMVAQRAALVVCNGGSPTAYQALNAGKPVLGICTNLDQQLNMSTLCAAGVGCMITASSAEVELIRETVTHMLAEPALALSAGRIRESISRYDVASQFEGLLCDILY